MTTSASDDELAKLRKVAKLGKEMREAQRAYFKDRQYSNLMASKAAERAFDTALIELNPAAEGRLI
jgi:hypothetical protein